MSMKNLNDYISSLKPYLIDVQSNLVSIPAMGPENDGTGELNKVKYIQTLLDDIGFDDVSRIDAPDERVPDGIRPNVIARMNGKNTKETVWVMAHTDVVPAGDLNQWNSDPFSLKVDGDTLIGRGVEDNHQGLVSALIACKALKDNNIVPSRNIGLAIVADEETASHFGLEYVLKTRPELFSENDLIIVPDAGDPEGITIEVSEKSIVWIKFSIKGKQCHASTPLQGINAHKAAAHLMIELEKLYDYYSERDENYDDPRSTFEVTKVENNVPNVNTIPAEHIFYMDCRILPVYALDDVIQTIRNMCDAVEERFNVHIQFNFAQKEEAAPPTPKDAPVVRAMQKAIKAVKNKDAHVVGIGGGTVAAFFRKAGLPAIVWGTIEDTCHQPNEFALISNTLQDAQVLAYLFLLEEDE